MKRSEAMNTFDLGLLMDLNQIVTPNNVVTNCLNGTLLTYNGNENVLLNDMGNGRVETAYLPEGYVPLGTTLLGGIIYIVSYNPFNNKCQIGSFPSPERNYTGDEISNFGEEADFSEVLFKDVNVIKSPIIRKKLSDIVIKPGDKFLVAGNSLADNIDTISHYNNDDFTRRYINFRIATIDSNGRLIYLDGLRKYKITEGEKIKYLNIKEGTVGSTSGTDIDEYRSMVSSDYHIFNSKIAGNLYIVGQLEVIDRISSVTWELIYDKNKLVQCELVNENPKYYSIKYYITTESESEEIALNHIIHTVKEINGNPLDSDESLNIVYGAEGGIDNNGLFNKDLSPVFDFAIKYAANEQTNANIDIIPCMRFGKLEYLKESVYIDFSLLGSNLIVNNIWKYYMEENGMSIKFDLTNYFSNKKTIKVKLKFTDLENTLAEIQDYLLPPKKSYNGTHTINIPFGNILSKNKLYKVEIVSDLESGESVSIIHYLYTNGVFNEYYLLPDKNNFDKEFLPLKITTDIENIRNKIILNNSSLLEPDNRFVTPIGLATPGNIRGKTVYQGKGTIDWHPKILLENTFNTFEINLGTALSISLAKKNPSVSSEIFDIPTSSDDAEWINSSSTIVDSEKLDITYENKKINYDINLFSPISASVINKLVSVENYYAPLLNTILDVHKYGIDIASKEVSPGTDYGYTLALPILGLRTFPSLGMSGGGKDNKGGGGTFYLTGVSTLYIGEDDQNLDTYGKLVMLGSADLLFPDVGEKGVYAFPDENITRDINLVYPNAGIVPVLLEYTGDYEIEVGDKKYKYVGVRYKSTSNRKSLFESDKPLEFVSFLLFVKIKESDEYVPLNYMFKRYKIEDQSKGIYNYVVLLNNLYAKRKFEDKVNIYTVNNISYVNKKVDCDIDVSIKYSYKNEDLQFNKKTLSKLYDGPVEDIPECFKIKTNTSSEFKSIFKLSFDINNTFVDTYEQYQNFESIPEYVRGGMILPPDKPNISKIYIKGTDNKLIESSTFSILTRNIITLENVDNQSESLVHDSSKNINAGSLTYSYENLDIFEYDSRTDTICIKRDKSQGSSTWKWAGLSGVRIGTYVDKLGTIEKILELI